MTPSPNRQSGGSEDGGQFAPNTNSESTVNLSDTIANKSIRDIGDFVSTITLIDIIAPTQ